MARPYARSLRKAQLLFAAYAARLLAPRLGAVFTITVVGGAIVRARAPDRTADFVDACYQVYTQLFFEHTGALPADGVLRALYFVVPLLGAFVVAEGLLKLGASLLDFQSHRDQWVRIMAKTLKSHVILVGLGHVGFRVLEELLGRGQPVVAIEAGQAGPFVEEARARGVPLLIGDARREALLQEAGVDHAAAVIACTDDDLVNLEVCVDARKLNPGVRLVMRMFDQSMAKKLGDAFSVESSFSTSALAAPIFAAAALDRTVHGAYRLGDTLMISLELDVPEDGPWKARSVADVEAALGAPIIGVKRNGRAPTHRFARTETLEPGDAVICHVASDELEAVQRRLRSPG